jgi:signal transduction histidine kinase/predicted ATPase
MIMAPPSDASDGRIGNRLFGRDRENQAFSSVFNQLKHGSASRVVLLHGPAGIGKSALIRSFQRTVGACRHTFAKGKCTRAQHQPQLFPFAEAMVQLINGVLIGDDAALRHIRQTLLSAVRGDEAILGDVIPEIHQVIGHGWRRPELPITLVQSRICASLSAAIGVFAQPASPLILAIDDIQWADSLSLSFIETFARALPANLLLILSFRDPWSDDTPPDPQFARLIETLGSDAIDMPVSPMSRAAINDLMIARFGDFDPHIAWLAAELGETTGGNPFSLVQRLYWLGEEGAIVFDHSRQHWTGRRGVIMDSVHREGEHDLLRTRLARLPAMLQHLLDVMALIAVPAPVWLIAEILGCPAEMLTEPLTLLEDGRFVRRSDTHFAMFHDRVLDAVMARIAPADKARTQVAASSAILRHLDGLSPDWQFRAASLLQEAVFAGALPRPEDRVSGARHLLSNARINRDRGALDIAARFVNAFRTLADPAWWNAQYPMMVAGEVLDLDILLANGLVELASGRLDLLEQRVQTDDDRARALQFRARVQTVRSDYDGAIRAALSGLALLGVHVPRYPTQDECDTLQRRLEHLLAQRDIADLVNLPQCEDPRALLVSQLLAALLPALFDSPNIRYYHVALLVEFTLCNGICPASPYGLAWYGVTVADAYQCYAQGMALGRVAIAIIDRYGFEAGRTETLVAIDQLSPWVEPISACLGWVDAAIKAGQASGDLGMTCYARNHLISDLLHVGAPLDDVEREADKALHLTRQIAFTDIEQLVSAQRAFVRLLRDGDTPPPVDETIRSPATLYWVHLYRAVGAYLTGDDAAALYHFSALEPVEWALPAHIDMTQRTLFTALSLARALPSAQARTKIEPHRRKLQMWAELNPDTFLPKLLLIDGELARLSGDIPGAQVAFDASARLCAALPHSRALAHELASRLGGETGLPETAELHRKAAVEHYLRWGAYAKAESLDALRHRDPDGRQRPAILTMTSEQALTLSRTWFDEPGLSLLRKRILADFMDLCQAKSGSILSIDDSGVQRVATAGEPDQADRGDRPDTLRQVEISRWRKITLIFEAPRLLTLPLLQKGDLIGAIELHDHDLDQALLFRQEQVLKLLAAQAEIALTTAELQSRLAIEADRATAVQNSLRLARIDMARNSHWISLGEFTATLSHEINQPLSGIALNTAASRRWLLRDPPVIAEAMQGLDAIAVAAERAADIVRAMKALTRQEPPSLGPVDINALVREVCAILENEIHQSGVAVSILPTAGDPCIMGDKVQLQQVILNLFINALDALEANERSDRKIAVAVSADSDKVSLRIEDSGPGIPDHLVERIFMPLVTSKQKGTGMGLAICKSIVTSHKGDIRLVPLTRRGCCFVLDLPLAQPA